MVCSALQKKEKKKTFELYVVVFLVSFKITVHAQRTLNSFTRVKMN